MNRLLTIWHSFEDNGLTPNKRKRRFLQLLERLTKEAVPSGRTRVEVFTSKSPSATVDKKIPVHNLGSFLARQMFDHNDDELKIKIELPWLFGIDELAATPYGNPYCLLSYNGCDYSPGPGVVTREWEGDIAFSIASIDLALKRKYELALTALIQWVSLEMSPATLRLSPYEIPTGYEFVEIYHQCHQTILHDAIACILCQIEVSDSNEKKTSIFVNHMSPYKRVGQLLDGDLVRHVQSVVWTRPISFIRPKTSFEDGGLESSLGLRLELAIAVCTHLSDILDYSSKIDLAGTVSIVEGVDGQSCDYSDGDSLLVRNSRVNQSTAVWYEIAQVLVDRVS